MDDMAKKSVKLYSIPGQEKLETEKSGNRFFVIGVNEHTYRLVVSD